MSGDAIGRAIRDGESRMAKAVESLEEDLAGVRTGRASPALVEKIMVSAYGQEMPLQQLAGFQVPEARQLLRNSLSADTR